MTQGRIGRARLLASAGLDDLADSELRYGARHDGQPQVLAIELARLAARNNTPDVAIRVVKRYAPGYLSLPVDTATEPLWRLAFPLSFWKPLTTFAQQRGIDPYLLAGLIRQESEFNPKVVSYANAYGLTQVMPATGRELSRKLKIPRYRTNMLFTPEVNLNIGSYYLRMVLDQLQGQVEATLASYNAGKSRVVKWLNWADFREPAEFVESIPFIQTREYVQSVLRNADVYRRLYGPNPFALGSTDDGIGAKDAGSTGANRKSKSAVSQRSNRKLHRVGNS
jgi:soluble lytic murein transglycosylase